MRLLFLFLVMVLLTSACDNFPKDPGKTLTKIKNGTLLVGYTENPPWVIKTKGEPVGLEAELIKKFAKTQGAKIIWVNDTEQDLFEQLEKRELYLVIGGFTDKNTWKKKISFTRPYLKQQKDKHVMAVLKGENAFIVALETFLHQQKTNLNAMPASHETHW